MSIFRTGKGRTIKTEITTKPESTAKPEKPVKPEKPTKPESIERHITPRIYSGQERKMDKRTLERLTDYTRRTRNILEEMDSILKDTTEITMEQRTPREQDQIIIDIRKKLNDAEKVSRTCDNSLILAISEIDSELGRYPEMVQIPSYFSLVTDSELLKKDFINNCKCAPKNKYRR